MFKIKKYITHSFVSAWNKIIVALLSLTAFLTGCENSLFFASDYGVEMKHYDLNINGIVKSKSDKKSIQKIRVIIKKEYSRELSDTLVTDSQGEFSIHYNDVDEYQHWQINFQDIDSIENGNFMDKDTIIDFYPANISGESATKSFTVFLEKKDNE